HQALELVLPLIVRDHALATVLPLARSSSTHLNELLTGDSPARQHLRTFLQELGRQDIQVTVRLRPGDPASQIVLELAQATYGLLVIAAEAEGQFVWQVLSRIDNENVWPGRPVLIVKPPVGITAVSE
ncbi:MAG TPA: hypothetical protein PLH39_08345, partial [Promineifilum sp.]|nr:hypothetical protein [Promineifilum sp.]